MKVKVINRAAEDFTRERKTDVVKVFKNPDPAIHPFERAREFTRALNATKLDKVFAKPFARALAGHRDAVSCMARSRTRIVDIASGSCDGELRIWDLATGNSAWSVMAHSGFVRGVAWVPDGDSLWTCGDDKLVKLWQRTPDVGEDGSIEPDLTIMGQHAFLGLDVHWKENLIATCGADVQIWDPQRSEAVHTLTWGSESVMSVKFNAIERHVIASTGSDRSIVLHDLRTATAMRKLVLHKRSNKVAWNPMEAFNFIVANEDHNLYTFDMRKLDCALCVHTDHVSAVLDVDYAPTGREFVSGSYDRTVRIWKYNEGRSREVYHGKRMQRIWSVLFSGDAKWIMSASDDFNIRLWKANASKGVKPLLPREQRSLEYQDKLKERFKETADIKRIARHRHLPKAVLKASRLKGIIKASKQRKDSNVRKHSKPGALPYVAERKKNIVAEIS
jgi:WD repeat and SOF domain-containing protein 1